MPSSSARATSSASARLPSSPASPYPAEVRNAALHALRRAGAQERRVGRRRGADEDEVDLPVRQVVDVGDGADAEHLLALQVGAEDTSLVAAGEEVVQRHEPELARVRRGAGDDDPLGLEQGSELLGRRRRSRRAGVKPIPTADLDEGVDGHRRTVGRDDQRVDVDADDVLALDGHPAEGHERGGEGRSVDGLLAAEGAEQALGLQLVDHLVGGHDVDRGGAEGDVGDRLGEDAADAEHHRRPELRVADHAGDELAVAPHERRDEHVDVSVVGRGGPEQLRRGPAHGVGVGKPEAHEAPLGLVGDGVTVELGDDRVPQRVGRSDGLVGGRRSPFRRHRDPERGEQLLGLGLGQGAPRHRGEATDGRSARPVPGGCVSRGRRRRRAGRRCGATSSPGGW